MKKILKHIGKNEFLVIEKTTPAKIAADSCPQIADWLDRTFVNGQ